MRIGLDLDNTIIFYDDAFLAAALARGLVPYDFSGTKQQVRDHIRMLPNGETEWQKLQGYVYGKGIAGAGLFAGVREFLAAASSPRRGEARRGASLLSANNVGSEQASPHPDPPPAGEGAELFIISHKTELGHYDAEKINLRTAALEFLSMQGVRQDVFFADTRSEKVNVIASLGLGWFIDDLVEVFEEPHFPCDVQKILFHTADTSAPTGDWRVCKDWNEITKVIFP